MPGDSKADRQRVSSGSAYEQKYGYSRAVRVGNHVYVAGTAALGPDGVIVAPGDGYRQTRRILEIIRQALEEAGSALEHVVQTRLLVTAPEHYDPVLRAHGEVFGDIRPAAALAGVAWMIDPAIVVEIDAVAVIPAEGGPAPAPPAP